MVKWVLLKKQGGVGMVLICFSYFKVRFEVVVLDLYIESFDFFN